MGHMGCDGAPEGADGKKDYSTVAPIGTGPYKVTEVKAGEFVAWAKNDDYFEGGPKGMPEISKINFRPDRWP